MSLGLVSYDSSDTDSEENEDDTGENRSNVNLTMADAPSEELGIGQQLKFSLPPPKRKGNAIKIVAPALPELDSDEEGEPQPKKTKSGKNISSLFAMLPKPKHATVKQTNRILIPHTLTKKAPPPRVPSHPYVTPKPPSNNEEGSDNEDDSSFFSLGSSERDVNPRAVDSDVEERDIPPGGGPLQRREVHQPPSQNSLLSRLETLPRKTDKPQATFNMAEQSTKSSYTKLVAGDSQRSTSVRHDTSSPSVGKKQTLLGHSKVVLSQSEPVVVGPTKPTSQSVITQNSQQSNTPPPPYVSQKKKSKLVSNSELSTQGPQSKLVSAYPLAKPRPQVQPELNEEPLSFSSTRIPYGYQRLSSVGSTPGYAGTGKTQAVQYGEPYQNYYEPHDQVGNGNAATSGFGGDSLMADKEFQKMIGKEKFDPSLIIDVNADDHMGKVTAEEWALKSMTEEKEARQQLKKEDLPTNQQKRKHQITYLARQAKERELELKNSWANNRMTRKETQSKYGF